MADVYNVVETFYCGSLGLSYTYRKVLCSAWLLCIVFFLIMKMLYVGSLNKRLCMHMTTALKEEFSPWLKLLYIGECMASIYNINEGIEVSTQKGIKIVMLVKMLILGGYHKDEMIFVYEVIIWVNITLVPY